jgi:hypothetical protein
MAAIALTLKAASLEALRKSFEFIDRTVGPGGGAQAGSK